MGTEGRRSLFPKSIKRLPFFLIGFAALVCAFVTGTILLNAWQSVSPPKGATTIETFQKFIPDPQAIVKISSAGKTEYVIIGRQPLVLLSEMPAGYLFSDAGELLDWSVEATDSDILSEKWGLAFFEIRAERTLTYGEVIAIVDGSRSPGRKPESLPTK